MNHLPEAQLYNYVFDHVAPTDSAATHLAGCISCRQTVDTLTTLAQELTIARQSQPSPAQLARYAALYAQPNSPAQSRKSLH